VPSHHYAICIPNAFSPFARHVAFIYVGTSHFLPAGPRVLLHCYLRCLSCAIVVAVVHSHSAANFPSTVVAAVHAVANISLSELFAFKPQATNYGRP
jgi:hypothetical protein